MHMADALLSPMIGVAFWGASAALIGYSAKKIAQENDPAKVPLMGVLGAFIFAAQMINFTIPGTGSSGHIGGGLLLAVLLGPHRAFITIASVLTIQCLFFADGGLLALGCNMFNLGFFPAFIAYPFIYKKIAPSSATPSKRAFASIAGAVAGLTLGAFAVVIQTQLSGVTELPFTTFTLFMMPIHGAIGVVEGLMVWAVLAFVGRTEPAMLNASADARPPRSILLVLTVAALITGGVVAWYASSHPDGLEWSMAKVTGSDEFERPETSVGSKLSKIQEKLAFLPDYSFKALPSSTESATVSESTGRLGTTVSGIVGSAIVLLLSIAIGFIIRGKPMKT